MSFAGSDTLATAYTLSLALKRLKPDLILCGRQTIDGDTGQVGPELSVFLEQKFVGNVMELKAENMLVCRTRDGENIETEYPVVCSVEKNWKLRLPSIRSKQGEVIIWNAKDLQADLEKCGFSGSPTKVLKTFENEQDRRKCKFITKEELPKVIEMSVQQAKKQLAKAEPSTDRLSKVWIVGKAPKEMAMTISDDITEIELDLPKNMAEKINEGRPNAVLWGSDTESKITAAKVAAMLKLGLCADCTALETDGNELYMYRPAFSGNIIAKIRSVTTPQMATVRTAHERAASIVVGVGMGAKDMLEQAEGVNIFACFLAKTAYF